ncbi:uncharacterized protein HD556DRAFT_1315037 [Suillus plorans]|uniref:Uncharacterized protein n=1 Tax=Suillus plorans TaxID=116603 RepID=A0A9P7A8Q0_9AGAM|nr:uncharacterized protein HD556DRAFT_1315037 [Suillus plorans]KAG1784494.1 hypothetical protein HD556DRAFT_1315037 [Suillus plorans]
MPQGAYFTYHPVLDGTPCDAEGFDLPLDQPPNHPPHPEHDTWHPFPSHGHFELADFIFHCNQMPAKQIDDLMQVLVHFNETHGDPPFNSDAHLYDSINSISSHDVQWQSLSLRHPDFEILQNDPDTAPWKCVEYDVWYRDLFFGEQGQQVWTDLMTGNWAWGQCNTLADDPDCHGAMFMPVILSSDKTTVSVVTGQNDYYLLYISASNLHNNIRCAHRESIILNSCCYHALFKIGVRMGLLIPKTWMGHNPFTAYFPRADIHELLAPDILHQIIKGTFKDHLVKWVDEYLVITYGEAQAELIWADIDHWYQHCCGPIISGSSMISIGPKIQAVDR